MAKASVVVKRWFQEVWCDGRPETISELFAEDGLAHGVGPEPVRGPKAFREFWDWFHSTFDDIHVAVLDQVDEGPLTYVRCVATMTFRGRPVTLDGGCLCRVRDGKIAESWNSWDFLSLLVRMGALPPDVVTRAFGGEAARFA